MPNERQLNTNQSASLAAQRASSRALYAAAALSLTVAACAPASRITGLVWPEPSDVVRLSAGIDSILSQPRFSDATWAVEIVDISTERPLYSLNANKNLIPASNTKLFTTATALDQLGPDFRYETLLYADGDVRNDTLFGDLVIRGGGDPTLSSRYIDEPLNLFKAWADSLKAAGVGVVEGDIVGDDRLFDAKKLGLGWTWDDEPYGYSAQVSALTFNDNCVFVTATGTTIGEPADLSWTPLNTDYVSIENGTLTVDFFSPRSSDFHRARGTNDIVAYSRVPPGVSETECVTVEDPAAFAAHILRTVLVDAGIQVTGMARGLSLSDHEVTEEARVRAGKERPVGTIATYTSPPLFQIVIQTNKESENLDAELLLRTVGAYRPPPDSTVVPGSAAAGISHVAKVLSAAGVDTSYVGQVDGSGLSRRNLLTVHSIARLLMYMYRHVDPTVADAFIASLPIGGFDGTLSRRYHRGAAARYAVAAKTGTMTSVSSLSGYVGTASGHQLVFSLMCNNYSTATSRVREAQDEIVNLLARM